MLLLWLYCSVRVLALVLTAPILGHRAVPIGVRLALGVSLGVAVPPILMAHAPGVALSQPTDILLALMAEVSIGMILGLGMNLLVSSAELAEQTLAQMAGLNWGAMVHADSSDSPVARLMGLLALMLFALMRGPELLVGALIDSFVVLPAGGLGILRENSLGLMATLLQQSCWLVVRCVGPAVAALLAAQWLIGLLSRVAPQLGIFQAGMGVNLGVFWLALLLMVSGGCWLFQTEIAEYLALFPEQLARWSSSRIELSAR